MCTYANIPKYIPIIPIFPDVNIYIFIYALSKLSLYCVYRFPKMRVPPNHPSH